MSAAKGDLTCSRRPEIRHRDFWYAIMASERSGYWMRSPGIRTTRTPGVPGGCFTNRDTVVIKRPEK